MAINQTVGRVGTIENLPNGSTHDLLLVTVTEGYPVGQVQFMFEETPRKITGIQKVAQIFMKVLFTQKGSDVINFNLGTMFPDLTIGANRTSNDENFLTDVTTAVRDAENQTKSITASLLGDTDSQLEKIDVLGLDIQTESLSLYLKLTTVAGETASIAIPFPELDLKLANG